LTDELILSKSVHLCTQFLIGSIAVCQKVFDRLDDLIECGLSVLNGKELFLNRYFKVLHRLFHSIEFVLFRQ